MKNFLRTLFLIPLMVAPLAFGAVGGAGSVWLLKNGQFFYGSQPGDAAGMTAADAYLTPVGFGWLGPGTEGLTIPTYRPGVCWFWHRYDGLRVYGVPFESWPGGVRQLRVDSTGVTIPTALYLRGGVKGGNGATDPTLYSYKEVDLSTTTNGQATKNVDIKSRFINTDAWTNLSLNGLHAINQYGLSGVGGGDVETGIGLAGYSEHRGNSAITGSLYGAEMATTMYNTGSVAYAFGALCTAQIESGSVSSINEARGVRGMARVDGTATGTISKAVGVDGLSGMMGTSAGTITDAIAGNFATIKDVGVTGTITNATGVLVPAITQGGTNNFGVRVSGAASGGSNLNQSLRVDAGETYLGGKTIIVDSLRVQSRIQAADSISSNGSGRFSGDLNVGFANASTTAGTLRINGGNSGTTAQRLLILRNNTTDFVINCDGVSEKLQYNHYLVFGTPAGASQGVMDTSGKLRLGDATLPTHGLEIKTNALISDSLSVPKGIYVGGDFISKIQATTYTPTRSAEANLDANVTMTVAQFVRTGATVTVSGRFTADPTLTATTTSFEITLPVASNLAAAEDAAGVAFCGNVASMGAEVIGVAANDTAKIQFKASDITSQTWSYTLTYTVK